MTSANDTTTSALTNPWDSRHPLRCISRPDALSRVASQRSNTPATLKSGGSAAMAAYDGTPSGFASAMFWVRNTSGSRRSTTGSGRSSLGPSVSGALTSEIQRSRTTAVENTGKMCYLCLQTKMSPFSPAVHYLSSLLQFFFNNTTNYCLQWFLALLYMLL